MSSIIDNIVSIKQDDELINHDEEPTKHGMNNNINHLQLMQHRLETMSRTSAGRKSIASTSTATTNNTPSLLGIGLGLTLSMGLGFDASQFIETKNKNKTQVKRNLVNKTQQLPPIVASNSSRPLMNSNSSNHYHRLSTQIPTKPSSNRDVALSNNLATIVPIRCDEALKKMHQQNDSQITLLGETIIPFAAEPEDIVTNNNDKDDDDDDDEYEYDDDEYDIDRISDTNELPDDISENAKLYSREFESLPNAEFPDPSTPSLSDCGIGESTRANDALTKGNNAINDTNLDENSKLLEHVLNNVDKLDELERDKNGKNNQIEDWLSNIIKDEITDPDSLNDLPINIMKNKNLSKNVTFDLAPREVLLGTSMRSDSIILSDNFLNSLNNKSVHDIVINDESKVITISHSDKVENAQFNLNEDGIDGSSDSIDYDNDDDDYNDDYNDEIAGELESYLAQQLLQLSINHIDNNAENEKTKVALNNKNKEINNNIEFNNNLNSLYPVQNNMLVNIEIPTNLELNSKLRKVFNDSIERGTDYDDDIPAIMIDENVIDIVDEDEDNEDYEDAPLLNNEINNKDRKDENNISYKIKEFFNNLNLIFCLSTSTLSFNLCIKDDTTEEEGDDF